MGAMKWKYISTIMSYKQLGLNTYRLISLFFDGLLSESDVIFFFTFNNLTFCGLIILPVVMSTILMLVSYAYCQAGILFVNCELLFLPLIHHLLWSHHSTSFSLLCGALSPSLNTFPFSHMLSCSHGTRWSIHNGHGAGGCVELE